MLDALEAMSSQVVTALGARGTVARSVGHFSLFCLLLLLLLLPSWFSLRFTLLDPYPRLFLFFFFCDTTGTISTSTSLVFGSWLRRTSVRWVVARQIVIQSTISSFTYYYAERIKEYSANVVLCAWSDSALLSSIHADSKYATVFIYLKTYFSTLGMLQRSFNKLHYHVLH